MKRATAILSMFFAMLLVGCQGGPRVAFIGRWTGQFVVTSVDPKLPINSAKRNTLKGFLQLYLTDSRCAMHLEGEQEAVDLGTSLSGDLHSADTKPGGHWEIRGRQLVLTFSNIKIDDAGGIDVRDPNKAFIQGADLRQAFSVPLALQFSQDKKQLHSSMLVIGPLTGRFEFTKDTLAH